MKRFRLLHNFPSNFQIQTSTYCNYACLICPHQKLKKSFPQGIMQDELYSRIITEFKKNEHYIKNIFLMLMNEPLLDPNIVERIKHVKREVPRARIILVTNGSLLNEKTSLVLINSGLDMIKVSLNAYFLSENAIEDNLIEIQKVSSNINNFIKLNKKGNVRLIVSAVKTKINEVHINNSISLLNKKGVECISTPLSNRTGSLENFQNLRVTEHDSHNFGKYCTFPFTTFNILHTGKVILCCNDWNQYAVLGDINEDSISEIWNYGKINHYRSSLTQNNMKLLIKPCTTCHMCI